MGNAHTQDRLTPFINNNAKFIPTNNFVGLILNMTKLTIKLINPILNWKNVVRPTHHIITNPNIIKKVIALVTFKYI